MSVQNKKDLAAKPAAAPKPPKKLVPRTAPKLEIKPEAIAASTDSPAATPGAAAAVPTPAPVKAKPARKPTQVEVTVAKHQKVLADALVKAQAIKYDQPKVMKQDAAPAKKSDKPAKPKKIKLVRDSYAMPEAEYAKIAELKKRMSALGSEAKKSELLRGGIAVLAALNDAELKAVMTRIERIKTGRPAK
ncbi:MAG: hypothetical protein H6R16_1836 [Proteobacteria bacterium]|nr:hypothetical protein [Pseudomonadota bacterium]